MFQLTRLLRGATTADSGSGRRHQRFNSRASCEARPRRGSRGRQARRVSTHAPLARRDCRLGVELLREKKVSTHAPLARRDKIARARYCGNILVSTHAPLARRDFVLVRLLADRVCFNSRASCEARLFYRESKEGVFEFQLTRLLRGATNSFRVFLPSNQVSTHAPLARRDRFQTENMYGGQLFQLTRLLRGATCLINAQG